MDFAGGTVDISKTATEPVTQHVNSQNTLDVSASFRQSLVVYILTADESVHGSGNFEGCPDSNGK